MTKIRTQLEALCLLKDGDLPLDRMALLIAAEHQPKTTLNIDTYLGQLDQLSNELLERYDAPSSTHLVRFVHEDLRFIGNSQHYHLVDNSYLNRVLDLRRGIPITLALVYLAIAERIGLSAEGVNFPGHFLIRFTAEPELLIDPFSGRQLSRSDCAVLLQQHQGTRAQLLDQHLAAASRRGLLMRLIENIKQNFWRDRDWPAAEQCLNQQRLLEPNQPILELQLGNLKELRSELDAARLIYAQLIQQSKDSDIGKMAAQRLLAMAAAKNQVH